MHESEPTHMRIDGRGAMSIVKNRGGDDSVQRIRYGMCVCMCVRERE